MSIRFASTLGQSAFGGVARGRTSMFVDKAGNLHSTRVCLAHGSNLKDKRGIERCPVIRSSQDIANAFEELLSPEHETLIAGTMDGERLICWNLIWQATDLFAPQPMDIFGAAIHHAGNAIFLVQNRKSTPANQFKFISKVAEAGVLLDIPLLDSVSISEQ